MKEFVKRESISSLYVLKALAAFGVVVIHFPLMGKGILSVGLLPLCVPIFIIISGYFLYTEDSLKLEQRVVSSVKKLAIIMLIVQIVYTIFPGWENKPLDDPSVIYDWIARGANPKTVHLWYISAMLYAMMLLWGFLRLGVGKKVLQYSVFLLPIPMFCSHYLSLDISGLRYQLPEFILGIIPYLSVGYLIRKYENQLLGKPFIWIALLLMSLSWSYGLHYAFPDVSWMKTVGAVGQIGALIALFGLCVSFKSLGEGSVLEYIGKELAGNIYYWHVVFFLVVNTHMKPSYYEKYASIYIYILTGIASYIIVSLQKRIGVSWLK